MEETENIFGNGWRSQALWKRDEEMGGLGMQQLGLLLHLPWSEQQYTMSRISDPLCIGLPILFPLIPFAITNMGSVHNIIISLSRFYWFKSQKSPSYCKENISKKKSWDAQLCQS